jgi:hypothetical protein
MIHSRTNVRPLARYIAGIKGEFDRICVGFNGYETATETLFGCLEMHFTDGELRDDEKEQVRTHTGFILHFDRSRLPFVGRASVGDCLRYVLPQDAQLHPMLWQWADNTDVDF